MNIIYAREPLTQDTVTAPSIFLAGPSPRDKDTPTWRAEAVLYLSLAGFTGCVFVPEDRGGFHKDFDYDDQVEWEWEALGQADIILFWVPRDLVKLPAFTTNIEFGLVCGHYGVEICNGKRIVVYGAPPDAPKNKYLDKVAYKLGIGKRFTLESTIDKALEDYNHV